MHLFKDGLVKIFSNGVEVVSKQGTHTKDGNVFTVIVGEDAAVELTPDTDGTYTYIYRVTVQSSGPWGGGSSTQEVALTGKLNA